MLRTTVTAVLFTAFGLLSGQGRPAPGEVLNVATFRCDVTPPRGQPIYSSYRPLAVVEHPLLAKGVILDDGRMRCVLCAVDYCELCNGAHALLRRAIAKAVETSPDRVAVQTVHQHTAPLVDIDALRILDALDNPPPHPEVKVFEQVATRLAEAARKALQQFQPCDTLGLGEAKVDRVASTRRVRGADGKIIVRWSSCTDPKLRAMPEGLIDPMIKVITFAHGKKPLARLLYYATHPQSFYGDPRASYDVPGIAREQLQKEEGAVTEIYFTGCAGDVTMGKYNDGSRQARTELAHRLHAGMKAAIAATEYVPAGPLTWRTYPLVLPARTEPEYTVAASRARLLDPKQPASVRIYRGAMPLAFAARSDRPIQLSSLAIGKLHIVNLPGEPMIEFQRYAQRLLPGCFVAVAGYGDSCCGYVCTDAAYREGGYEPTDTLAAPGAEARLKEAIRNLMGVAANTDRYVGLVQAFADTVLEHGRDHFGSRATPLFADGLQVKTLEPARWPRGGETWVLSNFASQQPLMRTLDGLTTLTGKPEYRQAAEQAARYAMENLQASNGLLAWGGHLAWDLHHDRAVGQYADIHELKGHQPYYRLMWRVAPQRTARLLGAIWGGHVLDWSRLDYNRHASTRKPADPLWNHAFDDHLRVPFPATGSNLSFCNVTPPLLHAAVTLAISGDQQQALLWARRLAHRWVEARDPKTGLSGGQLSYREHDRAQDALGHVHPNINEAKIVASYHQTCRYHHLPLAELQAGERLIAAGGRRVEVGRELIEWAADDLRIYFQQCYDRQAGVFVAKTTDGEPIRWREAREGYYTPASFAPVHPDGTLLWGYAMAYRLTRSQPHWEMLRTLAREMGYGELGQPDGAGRSMRLDPKVNDWRGLYVLLEIHRATRNPGLLPVAMTLADRLASSQTKTGLFPRPGRHWARTGDEIPLAILHLAATLQNRQSELPPPTFDRRFFHCEYDGPLSKQQRKRADKRTYDSLVFYGS